MRVVKISELEHLNWCPHDGRFISLYSNPTSFLKGYLSWLNDNDQVDRGHMPWILSIKIERSDWGTGEAGIIQGTQIFVTLVVYQQFQ
jgi:hypothetical protein